MAETKQPIAEIDIPNLGFILDSWHWWTSHETGDDVRTLSGEDLVSADLSDAPGGVARDQQYDNQRELALATGVIEIGEFLEAIVAIGCDGPVCSEPFHKRLNEREDDEAGRTSGEALRRATGSVD